MVIKFVGTAQRAKPDHCVGISTEANKGGGPMGEVDHAQLSKMRIAEALSNLNPALPDAHKMGIRTEVHSVGCADYKHARGVMMKPVPLQFDKKEG